MEIPIKMDDLGVSLFLETPISILYIHHHHGRKTIAPVKPVPVNESLDPENDLLK